MSSSNTYQLQSEVFRKVCDGVSKTELWDDLRGRREELKHLCENSNPSLNQYRDEMCRLVSTIKEQVESSSKLGKLAQAEIRLRFREIELAGKVCADLMDIEPETVTDLEDIKDTYQKLTQRISRELLLDCDFLLDNKYRAEIDAIYGAKEEKPDATEDKP